MPPKADAIQVICRIPRDQLCYFRYTLESYEGLCVATTLPGGQGRVRLSTGAGLRRELEETLRALARELPLRIEGWTEADPGGPGPWPDERELAR